MNLHNKTYMQDNKATLAALTGALCPTERFMYGHVSTCCGLFVDSAKRSGNVYFTSSDEDGANNHNGETTQYQQVKDVQKQRKRKLLTWLTDYFVRYE